MYNQLRTTVRNLAGTTDLIFDEGAIIRVGTSSVQVWGVCCNGNGRMAWMDHDGQWWNLTADDAEIVAGILEEVNSITNQQIA